MSLTVTQTEAERRARSVDSEVWIHDKTRLHPFSNGKHSNNMTHFTTEDLVLVHHGERIFVPKGTEITFYRRVQSAARGEILLMFKIKHEQITFPKGKSAGRTLLG